MILKISRDYNQCLLHQQNDYYADNENSNNIKRFDYNFLSRNLFLSVSFQDRKKEKEARLESRVINFAALVRDSISWRQVG